MIEPAMRLGCDGAAAYPPSASTCERWGGSALKARGGGATPHANAPHPRPLPTVPLRYTKGGEPHRPALGFDAMTIAFPAQPARPHHKIDLSWPILMLFAAVLCVLIILPMSWLIYYSLVDRNGAFTLDNFKRLVTDDAFVDPLITTLILATSSAVICCIVAAPMSWLVARTDMPLRRTVRALVTASFVTPPFLGAIAWELLAAPNSGLINKTWRALTGMPQDEYLFNIYSLGGLIFVISCYTFPYVFVLMANALDRIPGDLEDASSILGGRTWTTARRITIPLVLPALLAGALVAFLQAMTLFGSPAILAIPAGFHTMTTKIWSLFNYPPKPELAAAASVPLLVLTIMLLRAEHLILGRRGYSVVGGKQGNPRLVKLGLLNWVALAFVFVVLMCPVFLPYGALLNATFSQSGDAHSSGSTISPCTTSTSCSSSCRPPSSRSRTPSCSAPRRRRSARIMALVIAYLTTRRAIKGHRTLGFLATAPVAIPGIVLGVGLFLSYARPPLVLYGTLWILLIAFITIALPAAYQQLQSAFRSVHTDLEDASRILGSTRLGTLRRITAPLLRTSVIATWCFIFVGVIRELSAAIMLFTSETKVISVLIFDLNEFGRSRRHLGARPDDAGDHVCGRDRGQPHPGLRRGPPAQRMSSATSRDRCRRDSGGAHCRARSGAPACRGEAEVRGPAGRRGGALRHCAARGLRPRVARRLGRRRALHRHRPCPHDERRRRSVCQRHGRTWRGFRRHLRRRAGACRRRDRAGGTGCLRAAQSRRPLRAASASRSASRPCAG